MKKYLYNFLKETVDYLVPLTGFIVYCIIGNGTMQESLLFGILLALATIYTRLR
jgi:hypothetical protein